MEGGVHHKSEVPGSALTSETEKIHDNLSQAVNRIQFWPVTP
jgi:hypothetical protein